MFKRNNNTMSRKRKGQSTVEYIILVAAVIVVVLVFLPNTFTKAYNKALIIGTNGMKDMGNLLKNSRPKEEPKPATNEEE